MASSFFFTENRQRNHTSQGMIMCVCNGEQKAFATNSTFFFFLFPFIFHLFLFLKIRTSNLQEMIHEDDLPAFFLEFSETLILKDLCLCEEGTFPANDRQGRLQSH